MGVQTRTVFSNLMLLAIAVPLLLLVPVARGQYTRTPHSTQAMHSAADEPFTSGAYTFKPVPYSNGAMVQIFDTKTGKGVGTVINGNVAAAKDQAAIQAAYNAHFASSSNSKAAEPSVSPNASSSNAAPSSSAPAPAPQPALPASSAPSPAPAATPSPAAAAAQSGQYPILNWQQLEAGGQDTGMRLFFYLLRNDPPLQSDDDVLEQFMAANNCANAAFRQELTDEFNFPAMKAFYQRKMPEILKTGPMSISVVLKDFYLGDYDAGKGVFPFADRYGRKMPTTLRDIEPVNDLRHTCNMPAAHANQKFSAPYLRFRVNVPPVTISEIPMNEAAARSYVEGLRFNRPGVGRGVSLLVDIEIIDAPTKPVPDPDPRSAAELINVEGKITKITVVCVQAVGNVSNKTLGVIAP